MTKKLTNREWNKIRKMVLDPECDLNITEIAKKYHISRNSIYSKFYVDGTFVRKRKVRSAMRISRFARRFIGI